MSKARDILGTDRDNEFLQSFVRVGLKADEEDNAIKSVYKQPKAGTGGATEGLVKQSSEQRSDGAPHSRRSRNSLQAELNVRKKKRKPREYFDEIYTDKDRAAAVSFGSVRRGGPLGTWR